MTAPFEVGDVVVCVDGRKRSTPSLYRYRRELRAGETCRVTAAWLSAKGDPVVLVDNEPPHEPVGHRLVGGWNAGRFRKIDDEQIPEVLERLKSLGKPKVRA